MTGVNEFQEIRIINYRKAISIGGHFEVKIIFSFLGRNKVNAFFDLIGSKLAVDSVDVESLEKYFSRIRFVDNLIYEVNIIDNTEGDFLATEQDIRVEVCKVLNNESMLKKHGVLEFDSELDESIFSPHLPC